MAQNAGDYRFIRTSGHEGLCICSRVLQFQHIWIADVRAEAIEYTENIWYISKQSITAEMHFGAEQIIKIQIFMELNNI
jgi:hypothetical protein